nr:formylglycine-generating enzyme family protein [uncultured Carboxylicivirga sp.]
MKKFNSLLLLFTITTTISIAQKDSAMAIIPGGEYLIGNNMQNGLGFSPEHKVKIDSFLIDKYEVTNREYLIFCKETGYQLPEFWNTKTFKSGEDFPDYPVVGINYGDAKKYAEWVGKRLPTEAEWEIAARGELIGKDFPNGDQSDQERAKQETTEWQNLIEPVGSYQPNGYGLYDMSGNVWEWTADRFSETYYVESEYENPQGPQQGSNRVIRGGSWHSGAMCKKVFYRKGLISNWCDYAVGFRCAKNIE